MSEFKTLAGLLDASAEKYGNRPLFGTKVRQQWQWITYREFHSKVERLRAGFRDMGMHEGDVVAVISNNSVPFAMTVYAAYGLGASIVPMYEVQKLQDWDFIIRDSNARFLFVGNDKIKAQIEDCNIGTLTQIISFKPENNDDPSIDKLIESHPEGQKAIDIDEYALADILYTSGTTGMPKGVELTHHNIVQNVIHTFAGFDASCADRSLSFLPWAHAFGKTVELHIFPYFGASVALAESAHTIRENLKETHPTILVGVPKVFNKFYDTIHEVAHENPIARRLFEVTDNLSIKAHANKLSAIDKVGQKVLRRLIGPKIQEAMGGALRFCISGGAALAPEIIEFFDSFGITIFEGYGMTETSPIIAVNKHDRVKFGSVGRVLDCNQVRIEQLEDSADEKSGEVIVGGHCVMKQYHNAPTLTQEALTSEHELHTGDLGYIDSDGYLYLTGRVKEQYKLENGKYVVPAALEEKLNTSTAIEHAVIFGAARPYNIALIRPTDGFIAQFKKSHNIPDDEDLCQNTELHDALNAEIQKLSKDFRGYEKPTKFAVILDEFSIQNGLLTPALKLKRREVEKRYKAEIEKLYE